MDSRRTVTLALIAALALPSSAAAAPKPIKGKLSKGGYTVIALGADGRAKTATNRSFKVRPPAKVVTLHLRAKDGGYAGPLVVGGTARKAIVGVRAGAELGKVKLKNGYAVAHADPTALVKTLTARAKSGKPIGAGISGRVRSSVAGRSGLGRDFDRDGLPGAFDVDDDGDLIFDNVDRSSPNARPSVDETSDAYTYNARWVMNGGLAVSYLADAGGYTHGAAGYTVNQNAAGPFAASGEFEKLRDLLMINRAAIIMPLLDQPSELDCGGLTYCKSGGSGGFITRRQKFPDQFDDDGDGRGLMTAVPGFAEGQDGLGLIQSVDPKTVFGLAPSAGRAEFNKEDKTDTYFARPVSDNTLAYPITLRTVYGTLPALQSWGDSTRNITINYPVPQGSEGSENNGFTIKPNAAGDYVARLTIWRPQRDAVNRSGEGSGWIDLGGLTYTVVGKTAEQNRKLFRCPGTSYSTSDGNLSVTPGGLLDKAVDQPVNRANTLTFSVNLTECLKSSGIADWKPPGPTINLFVAASSAYGDVVEGLGFSFKPIAEGGTSSDAFSGTWKYADSSKTNIEWTIKANNGEAPHVGVIVYGTIEVTGGSQPDGWACSVSQSGRANDTWRCSGGPLTTGNSVTGTMTISGPLEPDHSTVDMLVCATDSTCQGFGMVYTP